VPTHTYARAHSSQEGPWGSQIIKLAIFVFFAVFGHVFGALDKIQYSLGKYGNIESLYVESPFLRLLLAPSDAFVHPIAHSFPHFVHLFAYYYLQEFFLNKGQHSMAIRNYVFLTELFCSLLEIHAVRHLQWLLGPSRKLCRNFADH